MKHFISPFTGLMDIVHLCVVVIFGMRQKAKFVCIGAIWFPYSNVVRAVIYSC
jgi:hypothetical protein